MQEKFINEPEGERVPELEFVGGGDSEAGAAKPYDREREHQPRYQSNS